MSFFIVTAESTRAAAEEAERAYSSWLKSFNHLYALHGRGPMLGAQPASFAAAERLGRAIAGHRRRSLISSAAPWKSPA